MYFVANFDCSIRKALLKEFISYFYSNIPKEIIR